MGTYMEIAVQIKKFAILSMRTIYRSARQHPFLVGMILFLVLLYRSFPFLFSLLLSASPVLVCTAVLLGTLLSFGQPNIPEIEKEEKISLDVVSLKAGVAENSTLVVERDESFVIEKYSGDGRDLVDKSIEGAVFVDDGVRSKVESRVDSPDCEPLIDESSQEIHAEKRVIEEVERGFLDFEFEKKKEIREEGARGVEDGMLSDEKAVEDHQYSLVREIGDDEILAADIDGAHGELVEAYKEDHLESSQPAGGDDDVLNNEDDEEDDSSYSESDRAESSSPDASLADIIPMLDELHPLLDLEAPQPPHMSHDESDVASEHSHRSDDSADSDAETENHADEAEEDGADDNDDDEVHGGKEDESKAAITWTEDDEKNLMDLGTSELERNQRLENLIARRRARKSFRLMAERNLIDLDSADLPFNVPPIATTRQNPFDLPYDSYENMGLPPIPGSAPSILLPRRNPFDLPYDSNEEKPDLKGDNFEQEFLAFHQKDTFFRRHESFSLGTSGLGGSRQDTRWKPVFVPERLASEGTSYPSFQRQLSEVSESKLSSVPDTESVSSAAAADEKKLVEQDFSKEAELPSNAYQASDLVEHGSKTSDDVDSVEIDQDEKRDVQHDEDVMLGEVENHHETELDLSETRDVVAHVALNAGIAHLETKPLKEEECLSRSSLSSLSEVDDIIPDVKNEDGSTNLGEGGNYNDESVISIQSSLEESQIRITNDTVDDNQYKEPVYDSSPRPAERLLSLMSISSDVQVEMSEMAKLSTSGEKGESFESQESTRQGESVDKDTSRCEELVSASSKVDAVSREFDVSKVALSEDGPKNDDQTISVVPESGPIHVAVDSVSFSAEIQLVEGVENQEKKSSHDEHGLLHSSDVKLPTTTQLHEDDKLHTMTSIDLISFEDITVSEQRGEQASTVVEHASVCSNLSTLGTEPLERQAVVQEEIISLDQHQIQEDWSSDKILGEEEVLKGEVIHTEKNEVQLLSFDSEIEVKRSRDLAVQLEMLESSYQHSPSNNSTSLEEAQPPLVVEQVSAVHLGSSSFENDHEEEVPANGDETIQFERDQLHSSSSDAKVEASILQDSDFTVASENESPSKLKKEHSWSDKPIVEPEIDDHVIPNESSITTEKIEGASSTSGDVCDPVDKVLTNLSSRTSDAASIPSDPLEYKPLAGEIDLQDSILDGIVNVEHAELSDHFDCEINATVAEEYMKEEVGEIKDIDEGLLSELDTVGDFRVKELDGELLRSELILEEANVVNTEPEILPSSSNPSETRPELPVLEVRSLEDIDLAFKQLHEGADVEEVILPSMVEERLVSEESPETISDLKVVEAGSLEDIEIALKQVSKGDVSELPTPLNTTNESTEVGTGSDLKVVEDRSLQDNQIALKQVSEGDFGELQTLLNSKNESIEAGTSSVLKVVEARSLEDIQVALKQVSEDDVVELLTPLISKNESTEAGTSSVLKVVEPRSLEDIEVALKQVSEDDVVELPTPLNLKNESTEVEDSEVDSTIETKTGNVELKHESTIASDEWKNKSTIAADEPKEASLESVGDSSTSTSNSKDKKSKDRLARSGSSSSSSSSSNSSSSDSE